MMVLLAVMLAATRQHAIAEALDVDARGAAAAPTDGGLSVDVGTNGSYAVKVDGATWFASDDAFITCGGKVFSLKAGTLALENIERSSGSDALGTYEQTTMVLHAAATPPATVEFSIKAWTDSETLEFIQYFPHGLSGTADDWESTKNGVSTSFPAWRPATLAGTPRGWMAYDGWDCDGKNGECLMQAVAPAGHVAYGKWGDNTTALPGGLEGSGPMAVFAADGSRTVVISAFTNTMAQSQAFVQDPPPQPKQPIVFAENDKAYCVGSGATWMSPTRRDQQPDPMSLAACKAKAVELAQQRQANAFDYLFGPVDDPATCGNCAVCRVGMAREVTHSSQNYSCFKDTQASQPTGPGTLHYGLLGSVTQVPSGWSSSVIVSLGKAPRSAVRKWGKKLTTFYGKDPALSRADFISTHLGYDTDNGMSRSVSGPCCMHDLQSTLLIHVFRVRSFLLLQPRALC